MKIVVFNIGCKVNQYECDVISEKLAFEGHEVMQDLCFADVYILNTCAVTKEAERKSRQAVSRCLSYNDKAKIIVIGCASQNSPEKFKKDGVTYVSGSFNKLNVTKHIFDNTFSIDNSVQTKEYEDISLLKPHRTRAYVKIQDGCDNFCSYCIIPYLRGRSRSRSIDSVVNEINILASQTKEIVITGIDVMAFGKDSGTSLIELFNRIRDVDVRIRLSSVYAEKISEELLDTLFSLKNFCPHFHLSLQSGDNNVLRAMNRHYTAEEYLSKIELIRKYDNNAGITTDVIVGYSTETDKAFENTCDFVKEAGFSDLHIFPYSVRNGTIAEKLKPLSAEIIKERKNILNDIKKDLHNSFLESNLSLTHEILTEEKIGDYNVGYTKNYIKVYTKKSGDIIKVLPVKKFKDGLTED